MTTNRREFIAGTGAVIAALSNLAACGRRADATDAQALLAEIAEDILADYPENATSLGIDKGPRAGLKAPLSDRSAAGQKAIAERVAMRLARMQEIGLDRLIAFPTRWSPTLEAQAAFAADCRAAGISLSAAPEPVRA